MNGLRTAWRVYVVPGAVFQSLMIGGGYGTGREIVEYFSRYGLLGGLLGLAFVTTCFAILLIVSYEFAQAFQVYDYRRFFRELLGRGWVAFEVLYLAMFAIVLAVICAASANLMQQYFNLPGAVGVACLLLVVLLFSFYGRAWVMRILTLKAGVLCVVVLAYFIVVGYRYHGRIATEFARHEIGAGWALGALRYTLYSTVVIPAMLFATRAIETRRQAVVSGVTSAIAGILPAMLMHLSYGAGYPQVLSAPLPAYWMISSLGIPALTVAYIVVLAGSLFDVGLGFIQSVNERLDGWYLEKRGTTIARPTRAAIAVVCVLISGGLSLIGIAPLIAQGYGTMAWGFLVLFVGPLLTVGVYRLARRRARGFAAASSM